MANQNIGNHTMEELREILKPVTDEIKKNLTVDKTTLSSYKRKLISTPDYRESARNMGIVGIIIICIVVGLLVFVDCTSLCRNIANITG